MGASTPYELSDYNGSYAPTGQSAGGFPAYAGPVDSHLHFHPKSDQWILSPTPFDPAKNIGFACIQAGPGPDLGEAQDSGGGYLPMGAQVWQVCVGEVWREAEVTAHEV